MTDVITLFETSSMGKSLWKNHTIQIGIYAVHITYLNSIETTTLNEFLEDKVEMVIKSELTITNIPWNDNLNDSSSEMFHELKFELEYELNKIFCNDSTSCGTEVRSFTEGSVNVLFLITKIEFGNVLPTVTEILSEAQKIIALNGMGRFVVQENSLVMCK